MTTEQKLQWVAVPGGVLPDGRLRVTALMSPRLRTDDGDTLAVYPDLLDWPAVVSAATWRVEADGTDLRAEVVSPAPNPSCGRPSSRRTPRCGRGSSPTLRTGRW